MNRIHHKIRGSYPGFIGIELPDEYKVTLLDEDNFNAYRKNEAYKGLHLEVKDQYCHFEKPVDGSWHVVIEGVTCDFSPQNIHIIYRAA
tara:strand:- start:1049 stop:1315 length:267 start_codon:yes stop_codon:yes gene_type:complete